MRSKARVVLLVAPLLFLGANSKESCPVGGFDPQAERDSAWRSASANAELVAPTAAGVRRRGVAAPSNPGVTTRLPETNFIDRYISLKLVGAGISPTSQSSDEEFLRRVTLDLTGVIPDSATVTAFVNDRTANKRERKIDELLASDAFVDRWTMWLGDLVQNVIASQNVRLFSQGRNVYYTYLRDSIRNQKPYDQLVRELIVGAGDSWAVGQANYIVRQRQQNGPPQDTMDNLAAHAGEKFLGQPLLCLSCHNGLAHLETVNTYLAGKRRTDFWGLAAFFSRTQTQIVRNADPANPQSFKFNVIDNTNGRYLLNTTDGNKSPRQPATGQSNVVEPVYMFDGAKPAANETYRAAFARMLTADRQFARNTVNLLWKEMYGLGIVEPVNAFDLNRLTGADVQPTHPELLEELTTSFIASGYNLRTALKTMAMSSTYQLSATYTNGVWNEAWVPYFARRYPKRMSAETVFDSIVRATGVGVSFNVVGLGAVTKAMALPDPTDQRRRPEGVFLDAFGRGNRDEIPRVNDGSITQALSLMNDNLVVARTRQATANSTVGKTLAATQDPAAIADAIYLATLSRLPTTTEKTQATTFIRSGTLSQRTEDLQWVLLNSLEFLFY